MLSVTPLLSGSVRAEDALRYGRTSTEAPARLLHYAQEKKPVVVWNATRRCGLHCAHCYSDSRDQEYPNELTTSEGLTLIESLADFGVPTLLFSGGEPLMRPDLFELARKAREVGMRTVLSTNGTLLDSETAAEAVDSGFSYAGVSIDGIGPLHDKMRGKKGAFDAAIAGIRAARAAGMRTGVRYTIHGLNREHLGQIFELAEREQVNRLCIYHLAYAGRGRKLSRYDLAPEETRGAVEEIFDRAEDLLRRGVDLEVLTVDNPVDNALLLMRLRRTQPERAEEVERLLGWNGGNQSGIAVASIDPEGRVHPDQFSWDVTVGSVRETPFEQIWTDANPALAPYRRRPRELHGRCSGCRYLSICNGGLRARAVAASGDFEAPDPACYLSEREVAA